MPFHVKRSHTAAHDTLVQYNGIRTTRWEQPAAGTSVLEIQTTPDPSALTKIPKGKDYLPPVYHWHWYQEETWNITEGRFIFTVNGQDHVISASDPQPVRVAAGVPHTFKADATHDGPCTVEIRSYVGPNAHAKGMNDEDSGVNVKFFRNIYSYLDDCYAQDVKPSIPQLLLLSDSAECSIAFSWGPLWLMQAVSYAMGVVVGRWWGGYVLGYRASYPEYWDEGLESRKRR